MTFAAWFSTERNERSPFVHFQRDARFFLRDAPDHLRLLRMTEDKKCARRTRGFAARVHDVQPTYHRARRVPHGLARLDSAMVGWALLRPTATGLPVPSAGDATEVPTET